MWKFFPFTFQISIMVGTGDWKTKNPEGEI